MGLSLKLIEHLVCTKIVCITNINDMISKHNDMCHLSNYYIDTNIPGACLLML